MNTSKPYSDEGSEQGIFLLTSKNNCLISPTPVFSKYRKEQKLVNHPFPQPFPQLT